MSIVETWRAVPGYEGTYEVSDLGRVRSLDRIKRDGRRWRGRMMRLITHERGYLMVKLCRDNACRMWFVHRLALMAFVGEAPTGYEARHLDGDSSNAALVNLAWGTPSENMLDQVRHGSHWNASKTHCPSGHPYDEANTYRNPGKQNRACLTCRNASNFRTRQARKAAA